jgi:anti-anti-sigma factor
MNDPSPSGIPAAAGQEAIDALDTVLTRPRPGTAVLEVRGEVDSLTAPLLETAPAELVDIADAALVVDMTGVSFLASSGLALLIRIAHQAEERGVRIGLVVATRAVRRPLEITGSDQHFDIHADLDAAVGPMIDRSPARVAR